MLAPLPFAEDGTVDPRILDKIKKCLRLSKSAEPHEAAAALRQAQKLMERHNVSEDDLHASEIGQSRVRSRASATRIKGWEGELAWLIAEAFACELVWAAGSSYGRTADEMFGHFIFVGREADREVAAYTLDVLGRLVTRARTEFLKPLSVAPGLTRKDRTFRADSYCHGWVARLKETVETFAKPAKPAQAIQAYQAKAMQLGGPATANNLEELDASAYHRGQDDAEGVSLFRPMGDDSPYQPKRLGG